nr:integrase, catalytic region, zinc finger, CCHC-type, peptidase aspartic, catalytic [Tanacetum cinerariifolium]
MLASGNYVQWKSRIKRYIDTKPNNKLIHFCLQNPPYKLKWTENIVLVAEGSSKTAIEGYMENYKNVAQDIRDQLNAEAEVVQIILTWIDNDIYSTVNACPNTCEMSKAIERLKQGESINVQDLETNLYWEFRKFTSHDGESLESYYSRFYKMMNELVRNQSATRNRGKAIVNSYAPTYDQEPAMVADDDEMSKEKGIDKLMALIYLSFKKINKPTNNNLRTSSNSVELIKIILQESKKELDAADNFGPIFDSEPLQEVQNDNDHYNVFDNNNKHPVQPESVNDTYLEEQDMKRELFAHQETISIMSQEKEAQIKFYKTRKDKEIDKVIAIENKVKLVEIILFIVDSGYSKNMTRNLKLLSNFMEKFLGTVKFGNDQIASILGYGDLVQRIRAIKRVYYVKGLNQNLFFIGQFYDVNLDVAFRKSTCYIRDLKGNDLLIGSHARISETTTTSNELDLIFSLMFDELLNGTTPFVSKSSDVHAADAPDKREHHNITHSSTTIAVADLPPLNIQTSP